MQNKHIWTSIALLLLLTTRVSAQIPLTEVRVVGSPPVLQFPRTCVMDSIAITRGSMRLSTRGNYTTWPAVSIAPDDPGSQAATLWVFMKVDGIWYGTGAERLRPNQVNGSKPEAEDNNAVSTLIGNGWLYDANRWGPMAGHNPVQGEHVGFLIAAGSTRSDNKTPVQERCDVVEVVWPGGNGSDPLPIVWREGQSVEEQPTQPTQPAQPTQPVSTTTTDLTPIMNMLRPFIERSDSRLAQLLEQMTATQAAVADASNKQQLAYKDLTAQHEQQAKGGGSNPFSFLGSAEFWTYAGSALAAIVATWGVTK